MTDTFARKTVLVTGIIALTASFLFFYFASRTDFDYTATYHDTVVLDEPGSGAYPYEFGTLQHSSFESLVLMQDGDWVTIGYDFSIGATYIVLWDHASGRILEYSSSNFLDYRAQDETLVRVYLASEYPHQSIPTEVALHHYDRPHWLFFGFGVVIASLAFVAVFLSQNNRSKETGQ